MKNQELQSNGNGTGIKAGAMELGRLSVLLAVIANLKSIVELDRMVVVVDKESENIVYQEIQYGVRYTRSFEELQQPHEAHKSGNNRRL